MFALGFLLASDEQERNPVLAARLFQRAAKGHRGALFNLGVMTYKGEGVPADPRASIDHFVMAASTHHPKAAAVLAVMNIQGVGTHQDLGKAKLYLDQAIWDARDDDLGGLCEVARSAVIRALGIRAAAARGDSVAT